MNYVNQDYMHVNTLIVVYSMQPAANQKAYHAFACIWPNSDRWLVNHCAMPSIGQNPYYCCPIEYTMLMLFSLCSMPYGMPYWMHILKRDAKVSADWLYANEMVSGTLVGKKMLPPGHGKMHRNTEFSQPKNHILLMHFTSEHWKNRHETGCCSAFSEERDNYVISTRFHQYEGIVAFTLRTNSISWESCQVTIHNWNSQWSQVSILY
jgi:hypothetical protein